MLLVSEESAHHPEAIELLVRSVAFTHSLYAEEQHHSYKLDELMHGRFFIGRHHGVAIGCGAYVWRNPIEVELKHMFVDANARGLGCGRSLLAYIEHRAIRDGVQKIVLETTRKQQAAIKLYESAGYVYRSPYLRGHSETLFMEKMLEQALRLSEQQLSLHDS